MNKFSPLFFLWMFLLFNQSIIFSQTNFSLANRKESINNSRTGFVKNSNKKYPTEKTINKEFVPSWHSPITNLPSDWKRFAQTVFSEKYIPLIVGLTWFTGVLIVTDHQTWKTTSAPYDTSPVYKYLSDRGEFLGNGEAQFGLVGLFASYGLITHNKRALRTALQLTEAILSTGGVVQLLKHITGRESPFLATTPTGYWDWFPNQIAYHKHFPQYDAMPSGHIATATATITVIAENYPEIKWIKPIGYVILAGIATSLVSTSIHWWSDIPFGVAIGYSFGMICSHPNNISLKSGSQDKKNKLSILPKLYRQGAGLLISYEF